MVVMTDAVSTVTAFCDAWATGDLDAIMSFFADDAEYHNIPLSPVTGAEPIRKTIEGFTAAATSVEFRVRNIAATASGDVVLTERVDVFVFPNGRVELPVSGTFELRDGKIAAWRDYFDLNQFTSALPK